MRKNHHGKNDRLVKRVFALCLALAVICTCLVPVFATEDLIDPQVIQEASRPVDDGVTSYPDGEVTGSGGDKVATWPVEGGGDNLDGGPNVKETEGDPVIEYDTSTDTDTSTVTQWPGEDDVVEKLQDMVVYRFWLKELKALDLQDITAQAQINNMTESEYLAQNGEKLWNLYFIQAVPRAETIADYSSYIKNPSSNQDPKGELRLFDYWYTLDELGNRVRLDLSDPTSNILDDKTTTVNVYAAWQDGTVGSDEEEDVDHEDLVDKNPVPPAPVDLTAKASYEDEDGNTESVDLPVEVKNLPSAAHSLSVIHMGGKAMQTFYTSHPSDFEGMQPLLGLKISPKNASGDTVQPAEGQAATVTVSGLNELPEIAAMEEAGVLTAGALKVLHLKDNDTVEILNVLTYTDGTLTFETTSFSPFVLALAGGYDVEPLYDRPKDPITINVGKDKTIEGWSIAASEHSWSSSDTTVATVPDSKSSTATVTGVGEGTANITHTYKWLGDTCYDKYTVTVEYEKAGLYIMFDPEADPDSNVKAKWTGVVTYNHQHAELGDLTGATWTEDRNIFFKNIGGADSDTAKQYIKYWPDSKQYTGPRVLKKDDPFRQTDVTYNGKSNTLENMILEMYKGKLVEMYVENGIIHEQAEEIVSRLNAGDITFTITPHKISKSNYETINPDKHIDCTVTVTCDKTFTARFNVKKPGDTGYTIVYNKLYLWNDGENNSVNKYEGVKTDITDENGVKWVFDGWYPENKVGDGPDEDNGVISDSKWPYAVQKEQLENHNKDRVVNFYAHYKKATSNVTITKEVKGLLGDTTNPFTFNVSITQKNGADCSAGVTAKKGSTEVSLNGFTLKHNETVTLENVPIGAIITVKESAPGEHYTVSATGHNNEQSGSGEVIFKYVAAANTTTAGNADEADLMLLSMDEDTAVDADGDAVAYDDGTKVDNNQIIVTNHATLEPDTGVLLDTLPYIVILAVVAGGVALLMLRKHRKEDD